MFNALRKLEAADWVVVATGLAVVIALEFLPETAPALPDLTEEQPVAPAIPPAKISSPVLFPRGTEMRYAREPGVPHVPKPPPMTEKAREVLRTVFRKQVYYGAFALSANAADFGWTGGFANLAAAEYAALALCSQNGPDCKVIAHVLPSKQDGQPVGTTLSYGQGQAWRRISEAKGPRAFAFAADGAWAAVRNSDANQAATTALADCEERRTELKPVTQTPCRVLSLWPE